MFAGVFHASAQPRTDSLKPLTIGEVHTIRSGILKEERTLNIYLPYGFDKNVAHPVIYLLDGTINEDFLHIIGLTQFFNMMFKMPDFIVVGISNVDRKRDFTFHTDQKDLQQQYPTTGHSEQFMGFLEKELLPYINTTFKTTSTRFIICQSLGGLLACEVLLKKPELFTHYLIVSPSLWWDQERLLKEAKALIAKQNSLPQYVYMAVGADEDSIMRTDARALFKLLQKKGIKGDYLELQGENHATILHQSINEAFKKLYPYSE